ncbi:MAG: hypothetical protein K0R73_760 [Candidatus Midichloriaceae bacterium]|jgi:hypothetical protein|nr:hypothetical protein [Candidatus Midichloriaceae bacterium]
MANATKLSIEVNLPEVKDRAVRLIAALTGEEPLRLHKMHIAELIQYLSNLMKCKEEQIQQLLVEHDQNQELDEVSLAMLWKLFNKGIVKGKKHSLGSIPQAGFDQLKFIMAMLGDNARFRVENGLGRAGSTITTSTIEKPRSNLINSTSFFSSKQAAVAINSIANSNTLSTNK